MTILALFDIDGVLADDRHRVQHALNKNWNEYFSRENMLADPPYERGRAAIEIQSADTEVSYLTGRREDTRDVTVEWLTKNGFRAGELFMRPIDVKVPLAQLKLAKMKELISTGKYDLVYLWDDDPEVIRVVQAELGQSAAVHCTWHIKPTELVRKAVV